ncbi:MAG TPA: DUF488 family protein [Chloroflexota bacterium]|nr:DUF488 family protein [Chloroflexota bacterium]
MIKHKSVYDPVEGGDGFRVLAMTVVRDRSILEQHAYDLWMRSLGPTRDSLQRWWDGKIDTDQFYAELRQDVPARALERLRRLEKKHGTVTVLCREHEPDPCHRYELVRMYIDRYPDAAPDARS